MANQYSIPYSRALFGAAFVQWFIYSFLYMVEGCKYHEIKNEEQENAEHHAVASESADASAFKN